MTVPGSLVGRGPDRGAGTVLVLTVVAAGMLVVLVVALLAQGYLAGARAHASADLAALAAARTAVRGEPSRACRVAEEVAREHGAGVLRCSVEPSGAVVIEVEVTVPFGPAHAIARAGPAWLAGREPPVRRHRRAAARCQRPAPRPYWVPEPGPGSRTRVQYPERDKTGQRGAVMSWAVLIVSGMFEAVWATALGRSEGFSRLGPTLVFAAALVVSMGGLAYALRDIPTGTGYAVWVGVGAALTVVYAMVTGTEAVSLVKILLMLGLVACIVGLKLVSDAEA